MQVEQVTGNVVIIIASHELYYNSLLVGIDDANYSTTGTLVTFSNDTYGSLHYFFGMAAGNNVSNLTATAWDLIVLSGTKNGKGIVLTAGYTSGSFIGVYPPATLIFTDNAVSGIVRIDAPTGGVAQFKGLTMGS